MLIAPAEQRRLLAAITDESYRDAAEFKFVTGWRGDEVMTLQWKYIRHDSGTIRLVEQYSKTGEPRDFPLIGTVAKIIARWEKKRLSHCSFVFHRGGRAIGYTNWRRAWQRAACSTGFGRMDPNGHYQGVNLHDTRRAFMTDSIDSGMDPQQAKTLSGHKTNAMLERYRIVRKGPLVRAIERREQYVEQRTKERKIVALSEHRERARGTRDLAQISHNPTDDTHKAQ